MGNQDKTKINITRHHESQSRVFVRLPMTHYCVVEKIYCGSTETVYKSKNPKQPRRGALVSIKHIRGICATQFIVWFSSSFGSSRSTVHLDLFHNNRNYLHAEKRRQVCSRLLSHKEQAFCIYLNSGEYLL